MELKDLLEGLQRQIRGGMEPFFSYDDISELPPEQFEEMQRIKVLVETSPSKYFTCRECPDEDCDMISLTIDTDRKTGKQMGFFLCEKERGAGFKKIELERLRRWEILPDKIEAYLAPKVEEPAKIQEEIKGKTDPEQKLNLADEKAYQSYCLAEQALGKCTDKEAYNWLKENGDPEYDLPSFKSWEKYVRNGRKHYKTNKNTPRSGRKTSAASVKDDPEILSKMSNQYSRHPVDSEKAD